MPDDASSNIGNLTLDLLVSIGNPRGIEEFCQTQEISSFEKKKAFAEADIVAAIKCMDKEAEGGIHGARFQNYFDQPHLAEYFATTTNTPLLEKIVQVLYAGTNANMEAYAQITAVDVLRAPALAGALRRNLKTRSLREEMSRLVRSAYSLLLFTSNIDAEAVESYFPVVNSWKDLVIPQGVVREALKSLPSQRDLDKYLEEEHNCEFFNVMLDKLIEMTDRQYVSLEMYEHFRHSHAYGKLVAEGRLDAITQLQQASTRIITEFNQELLRFEVNPRPSKFNLERLAGVLEVQGKEVLSHRIVTWFSENKPIHAIALANYKPENPLYDAKIVRSELTSCLIGLCQSRDISKLCVAFDFPEQLIDFSRPELKQFADAYKIHRKTYEELESNYL